jgi:hypothetical protein
LSAIPRSFLWPMRRERGAFGWCRVSGWAHQ